jgi:hypothetical protein
VILLENLERTLCGILDVE